MAEKKKGSELESIMAEAIAGAGGDDSEGPDFDAEANEFLNGIYTGNGMDDPKQPGRQIYAGGILVGKSRLKGNAAISYIQQQLVRAGLLDADDITHPGSPADGATRDAMARARDAQRQLGTRSILETLEVLQSQFPGWDKIKGASRQAFVAPAREQQSAKDIASAVRVAAREFTGEDASEEDINRILLKVRQEEEQEYQGILGEQRQAHAAGESGGDDMDTGVINRAASPQAIAEEEFLQSDEGLTWSVGKGLLGLLSMMRSGA